MEPNNPTPEEAERFMRWLLGGVGGLNDDMIQEVVDDIKEELNGDVPPVSKEGD